MVCKIYRNKGKKHRKQIARTQETQKWKQKVETEKAKQKIKQKIET